MEILQRSIRKMKRSEDEYIAIFKDYIAYAMLTGEKITKTNFGRWSYQKFGSNIECALRRKFKKKNGKSGFSEIMEIVKIGRIYYEEGRTYEKKYSDLGK